MKTIILLTGPIGSGKSAARRILAELSLTALDADQIAHDMIQRGAAGHAALVGRFGEQILDAQGQVDRLSLNRIARADPTVSEDIRGILFPLVRSRIAELIEAAPGQHVFITVHDQDAYGTRSLADRIWYLAASDPDRIESLARQRGWSAETAARFVQSVGQQTSARDVADVVLRSGALGGRLEQELRAALSALGVLHPNPIPEIIEAGTSAGVQEESERDSSATSGMGMAGLRGPIVSPARVAVDIPAQKVPPVAGAPVEARSSPGLEIPSLGLRELRLVGRRILASLAVLLVIAFLTSWGLILAEYGRQHLPILPVQAAIQAVGETARYISAHPASYVWDKQEVPWLNLVAQTLGNSAGLLLLSMGAAVALGFPLGMAAARLRRGSASALVVLLSVAGASTPSFLFGMMLWAANIWVHRTFDIKVLPATGFGWDAHVLMPLLVLAMRPMAQVAQITYISVSEALGQDYIRTAESKGLTWRAVQNVHLLPNVLIPILNTLGTSLRFSLSSLPIVEVFFHWPGVGMRLLDAIQLNIDPLVMDLILSLGLFFLFVNLAIEFSFPLIDPRLRSDATEESRTEAGGIFDWMGQAGEIISAWVENVRRRFRGRRASLLPPLPEVQGSNLASPEAAGQTRRSLLRNFLRNPALIVGSLMLLALALLTLCGEQLPGVEAYQVHGVMSIDGEYSAPPFKPSTEFAWGSDHIGRDLRSLVLAGARRTMTLVFFGMLARVILGAALGLLAGWQRGSWFDRLVSGATGIWAAFPATLFAMIVIQALGIQQGMWVFIAAISVVGWGEVAQIVRAHVVALKPQAFIESAHSIGARSDQVLVRHILPNIVNPLTVLAALEMGGILMLLAELGFLNIFMGGGFRAMIGEAGRMVPVIATYSDVPEWSALIANVREYWRSYPWMALYPGLAIFLAIIAFNLFGEGLRRFLDDSAIGLGRFLNRYTLLAGAALAAVLILALRSTAPLNQYRAEGLKFDAARVMKDIQVLSDTRLQGRETGTPGADLAAIYIAQRLGEIGIFPAGEHNSYYQRLIQPRVHMLGLPTLALAGESVPPDPGFVYRKDFVELALDPQSRGEAEGRVMGAAFGPMLASDSNRQFRLSSSAAMDHILIVRSEDAPKVVSTQVKAVLVVADDEQELLRRDVYPYLIARMEERRPYLLVTAEVADRLLATAGSSLAELDRMRADLAPSELGLTSEGEAVAISVPADRSEAMLDEAYVNVLGVIPGQGYLMGTQERVIVVGAYYDGVGTDPTGTVYPGANDNASGVAMMLELARLLKESEFQPDKTVLFAAWPGGERLEGLSTVNILNARAGASDMTVETVVELSGVGYGTGNAISIGNESSFRLVQLYQEAARRYDAPTTTLGRGPHYDMPPPTVFGGRDATTLSISWDGSDHLAHTPQDRAEIIDASKLSQTGRSIYLTLLVLSRETEY